MIATADQSLVPGVPTYTPTSLVIHPDTKFEDWESIGHSLRQMHKSVLFWIGDWINAGEAMYGEKYSQALEVTGYDAGTLRNAAFVCARIEPSRRHDNLTFSHHQEVAALATQDEADELLDKASRENLTTSQVRAEVRILKGTAPQLPYESEVEMKDGGLWIPVPSSEFEVGQKVKITKIKGGA